MDGHDFRKEAQEPYEGYIDTIENLSYLKDGYFQSAGVIYCVSGDRIKCGGTIGEAYDVDVVPVGDGGIFPDSIEIFMHGLGHILIDGGSVPWSGNTDDDPSKGRNPRFNSIGYERQNPTQPVDNEEDWAYIFTGCGN